MHFPDDKISPQTQKSDLHCEATPRHCIRKIAGEMQLPQSLRCTEILLLPFFQLRNSIPNALIANPGALSATSCKSLTRTLEALREATVVTAGHDQRLVKYELRPLKGTPGTEAWHHTEKKILYHSPRTQRFNVPLEEKAGALHLSGIMNASALLERFRFRTGVTGQGGL